MGTELDIAAALRTPEEELEHARSEGRYIRVEGWVSRHLPTPRDLFFYLPPNYYAETERQFPVLLLHDGQNVFDGALSYVAGSSWRAGQTADEEFHAGRAAAVILVGVANTGNERMGEYTPSPDRRLGGGRGPLYARLLIEEILPVVRERFRVSPGAENTGLAGSSLGGLITLAIGLRYPQIFGRLGVLSPSIWWDEREILDEVRALRSHLPLRIWMDMGLAEGLRHVKDADLLARMLQGKGWRIGEDLQYARVPGGVHNEDAWARRFGDVLRFLFPAA